MDSKLTDGWVYEVLIESGNSHFAPMGVRFKGDLDVEVEIYKGSETLRNIEVEGSYKIVFADATGFFEALRDTVFNSKSPDYSVCVDVVGIQDAGNMRVVSGRLESKLDLGRAVLVNRADALFIEALVESTKPSPRVDLIKDYARVIRKVAPESVYAEKIEELM